MENILENTILHTESLYKKLVSVDFDIKHGNSDCIEKQIDIIQVMLKELINKLACLNIKTEFPTVPEEIILKNSLYSNLIEYVENLMHRIENIHFALKSLQNNEENDVNEQKERIKATLEMARNTFYSARVVEGKIDVASDCRKQFGGVRLHDLFSRHNILEVVEVANILEPQLEKLSKQLKAVGINEDLFFSMYGPLELSNVENYFAMLLMGQMNIYNQLIEKHKEIKKLVEKLRTIIECLQKRYNEM